jgi:HSP20 family protein
MKSSTRPNLTMFLNIFAMYAVSGASAWSCGPTISSSFGVISSPYGNVGCRPNESYGSSYTDIFTIPDIQSMQRRRQKQRYYYRQFMDEFRNMNQPMSPWKIRSRSTFSPRYDITESDNDVKINMDVPGIDMSNIGITLDNETKILTVAGSRDKTSSKTDDENGSSESRSFTQKFVVKNPTIDINQISAQLENGVLMITLQKFQKQEVKENIVRTIPIMSSMSTASATTTANDNITNSASSSTSVTTSDDGASIGGTTEVVNTSNNVQSSTATTSNDKITSTDDSDTKSNSNDETSKDESNDTSPTK